jgi:hypothetical protein
MGYWGTLIATRCGSKTPAVLAEHGAESRREAGRDGGWAVFSVAGSVVGDEHGILSTLVSAPVLAAYIADSDYGWLTGLSPEAGGWQAWLGPATAYALTRDHHMAADGMARRAAGRAARQMIRDFGLPPAQAARRAVAWAAEEIYFTLLQALGVRISS